MDYFLVECLEAVEIGYRQMSGRNRTYFWVNQNASAAQQVFITRSLPYGLRV